MTVPCNWVPAMVRRLSVCAVAVGRREGLPHGTPLIPTRALIVRDGLPRRSIFSGRRSAGRAAGGLIDGTRRQRRQEAEGEFGHHRGVAEDRPVAAVAQLDAGGAR